MNAQLDALKQAGCVRIFEDLGISGAAQKRPGLAQLLQVMQPGDILVVWKLDRLGRSLAHLVAMLEDFGQRGIGFQSLTEAIDTTTAGGRLMMHIVASLAEFERSLIGERTRAGMSAAKRRGKHIGRPPRLTVEQAREAYARIIGGDTIAATAHHFNVHPDTLTRALNRLKAGMEGEPS